MAEVLDGGADMACGSRFVPRGEGYTSTPTRRVGIALLGALVLAPFLSKSFLCVSLAAVVGIMVFISLDELLPTAQEYGEHHLSVYGLVAGMAVMALSLLLFA